VDEWNEHTTKEGEKNGKERRGGQGRMKDEEEAKRRRGRKGKRDEQGGE
jgi:hypothetical protein